MMNGTTIVAIKKDDKTAIAGDGQITFGNSTIMKNTAKKVRKIYNNSVIIGFAGSVADALTLAEVLEEKLEQYSGNLRKSAVELAKEWKRDKVLRKLEALFIAAGAFHVSKVGDLIPEIQGRFPIKVELQNLTEDNFVEILTKPKNAIIKQYQFLLKTEGINLKFTEEAIKRIARRLQTVLEKLLEDISYEAPDLGIEDIIIDESYVNDKLMKCIQQEDISKYIL